MNTQSVVPTTTRMSLPGSGAQGYRLSSAELHAGLDVRALSMTELPLELVTELLRLRKAWGLLTVGALNGTA